MLLKDVVKNPQDMMKLEGHAILHVSDIGLLRPQDWPRLGVSQETVSLLKSLATSTAAPPVMQAPSGGGFKPNKFTPGKPMVEEADLGDDIDDSSSEDESDSDEEGFNPMAAKVTSGHKTMAKAQASNAKTAKMKQCQAAIRAAHRLALRAELEAIRRADDLARLQKKRAELCRLYKKYKAAPEPIAA